MKIYFRPGCKFPNGDMSSTKYGTKTVTKLPAGSLFGRGVRSCRTIKRKVHTSCMTVSTSCRPESSKESEESRSPGSSVAALCAGTTRGGFADLRLPSFISRKSQQKLFAMPVSLLDCPWLLSLITSVENVADFGENVADCDERRLCVICVEARVFAV